MCLILQLSITIKDTLPLKDYCCFMCHKIKKLNIEFIVLSQVVATLKYENSELACNSFFVFENQKES